MIAQYGEKRIWPMRVDGFGLVVLRRPKKGEWRSYQRDNNDKHADKAKVEDNLRRLCFAYPDKKVYDEIIDEYPALGDLFSIRIGQLASGAGADGSEAVQDLGKDLKKPVATP